MVGESVSSVHHQLSQQLPAGAAGAAGLGETGGSNDRKNRLQAAAPPGRSLTGRAATLLSCGAAEELQLLLFVDVGLEVVELQLLLFVGVEVVEPQLLLCVLFSIDV